MLTELTKITYKFPSVIHFFILILHPLRIDMYGYVGVHNREGSTVGKNLDPGSVYCAYFAHNNLCTWQAAAFDAHFNFCVLALNNKPSCQRVYNTGK